MAERSFPKLHAIASHEGFADALVAGLVARHADPDFGLARVTLLLPSTRAVRTVSEAFVRHSGEGLLLPRMGVVADLDLDDKLGLLLDPLGAAEAVRPAADPARRWLRLAQFIPQAMERLGRRPPRGAALLKLAFELGYTIDRLFVEEIPPERLWDQPVLDVLGDLSEHWVENSQLFFAVQQMWHAELEARGEIDSTARRNQLFRYAAQRWKEDPPAHPVIAAGITSAAPALARLLRAVADLPQGAVILPDLDLSLPDEVWDELGRAGAPEADDGAPFARQDALSHPQYHLKLLLNRMGVARGEVQPWPHDGADEDPPARAHAISSLFLPPQASKIWVDLPAEQRRLSGVRLMETAHPEEEAQSIALLVREALETPEKRVAIVTPDRSLARRVVSHLKRWNIEADDSAGRPLSLTVAGRALLMLAEVAADELAPVALMALLEHPLAGAANRNRWLRFARAFQLELRGPRPAPGFEPLREKAARLELRHEGVKDWWAGVEAVLQPLVTLAQQENPALADLIDALASAGEALCGEGLWARADGRALAAFVEELRLQAREVGTVLAVEELPAALRDAMERVAVRPPYGGHTRVAIYGLIESRMARADLVICAALNEGTWPASPVISPLLAPPVLRVLGVPVADFRLGLAGHDLAAALGSPEVVLSRARRDASGPAVPSRFLLRVVALLGELADSHRETRIPALARALDDAPQVPGCPRPEPRPSAEQRRVRLSVTALDRLRSDPYQFYASHILRLRDLDPLDAEPSPAWQGTLAHAILETWHATGRPMEDIAAEKLEEMGTHPLMQAMWRPRLMKALEWVQAEIAASPGRKPVLVEQKGTLRYRGVEIIGRIDRLDRLPGGGLAVIDYKTGRPPSVSQVEKGYALQLGTLGLMVEKGGFEGVEGEPVRFEYWSLARNAKSETGFGSIATPLKLEGKRTGIVPEDFLPEAKRFLDDALDKWILGDEPFTARLNPDAPGYDTYDHLMRLEEWMGLEE
ncbi:double-strand break repair protein AddB [Altericroceibacterium xinjiangense]|uniref:double-strand break repair protein AddB n=1 Tax=Altericroceibacterium xinjiangense TaxID=762261 RepID=UPI000F7E7C99|nr:double-strand break repair protein AddB [Altericroceibacterium xinjiangense]